MPDAPRKISIVTASRNTAATIEGLYRSLKRQTCRDFEWIVADAESQDGTVQLLQRLIADEDWIRMFSAADFGVYDALNKAIRIARADYYVVAGADDAFEADAVENYVTAIENSGADVIFSKVYRKGRLIGGFFPRRSWIGTARVFGTSHSCGMLFRTTLHQRFGEYSSRFPLLADVYFLKVLLISKQVQFAEAAFVAGSFGSGGLTSHNKLQILAENWQIQMFTEQYPLLQVGLFICKVLLRLPAILGEATAARRKLRARSGFR